MRKNVEIKNSIPFELFETEHYTVSTIVEEGEIFEVEVESDLAKVSVVNDGSKSFFQKNLDEKLATIFVSSILAMILFIVFCIVFILYVAYTIY